MSDRWINRWRSAMVAAWVGLFLFVIIKNSLWPHKGSVYPLYAQSSRDLWSGVPPTSPTAIQHLPWFGDLLAPFAHLPDFLGSNLWFIAILIVFISGTMNYLRLVLPPEISTWQRLLIGTMIPWIGLGSLINNQTNTLIAGLLLWSCVCIAERRWKLAACLIALTSFKLYPLVMGLVFVAMVPRQLAIRLLIAILMVNAIPFVLHPSDLIFERHLGMWNYLQSGIHNQLYDYTSLREFGLRWVGPLPASVVLVTQAVTGLIIALICRRLVVLQVSEAIAIRHAFTLTMLWCITFGPSVEPHTFLLASVPIACLVVTMDRRSRIGLIVGLMMVAIIGPLQNQLLGSTIFHLVLRSKIAAIVNLGFWLIAVRNAMRDLRLHQPASSASIASAAVAAPDSARIDSPRIDARIA